MINLNEKNITLFQAYEVIFEKYDDVLTVKNISEMLKMCTKRVYELIRSGKIRTIPCGKVYRVAKIDIIDYVINHKAA